MQDDAKSFAILGAISGVAETTCEQVCVCTFLERFSQEQQPQRRRHRSFESLLVVRHHLGRHRHRATNIGDSQPYRCRHYSYTSGVRRCYGVDVMGKVWVCPEDVDGGGCRKDGLRLRRLWA